MSDNDKELPADAAEEEAAQTEEHDDEAAAPDEQSAAEATMQSEQEAAESAAQDEAINYEDSPPGKSRSGVAWLAMLLAIVAVAGVLYTQFENWRNADDDGALEALGGVETLQRRADQSRDDLAALSSRVDSLPDRDFSGDIEDLRLELNEQIRALNSLPPRMSAIENSVASLAGISTGARETFLLAEAEYYMQIANAQLQLANNPQLASLALGMADERVTQLSNPALTDVRRALSDELAALEAMEKPDIEGATLTLASLAHVVDSLPLAGDRQQASGSAEDADPDAGNIERAWQAAKGAMSGLVKVTPPDQAKLAMLSPDAEYFLRNNIAMQLQAARLALLRGEQTIFEQALDDVSTLLATYFDGDSAQVSSARQTIAEIRESVFTTSAPDISASLQLLRQFRTLSETTE